MKAFHLMDELAFDERRPQAEPLLVDESGRVLRFALRPGQHIKKHSAPHASVHIIVMKGKGMFAGSDDREQLLDANGMAVFGAGELHTVRALDEELVFIALLPKVARQSHRNEDPESDADAYLSWHV